MKKVLFVSGGILGIATTIGAIVMNMRKGQEAR